MGSFVAGLDATVVNVALPATQRAGRQARGQQWISNGYLLALGALILVSGSLGDVLGERRVFSTASRASVWHQCGARWHRAWKSSSPHASLQRVFGA